MTERDDDREDRQDEAMEALLGEAFSARGELLPTTEAEVARAERDGVEFEGELPESLRSFSRRDRMAASVRASGDSALPGAGLPRVVSLDEVRARRRGRWVGYASAGVLGAAAASVFWVWAGPGPRDVDVFPAGDPSSTAAVSAAPSPLAIEAVRSCESPCCAGSSCARAEGPLKECSSGRTCVPCSLDHLRGSLYRLRVGSLALSPAGAERRDKERWGALELCVRVGSSDASCVAAHVGSGTDEVWSTLPTAVSAQDLVAGFELDVRRKGGTSPLATWKHAVVTNPTLLCRGLSVSPKPPGGEILGTLSVFFTDAHFVELARGETVPPLVDRARAISFADVSPEIYESTRQGSGRFALVVGPLDKVASERLRWKLLDANVPATVTIGGDYLGQPRPVRP